MAAIVVARRKNAGQRAQLRVSKNQNRLAKKKEMDKRDQQIIDFFSKSDVNASESLDAPQLKSCLEQYAYVKMGRTPMNGCVRDAEVQYVMRIANAESGSMDISSADIFNAINIWESLADDQEKIKAKFDEFDKDNTGTLSPDQVGQMLTWMNGGAEVSPEEIQWVIEQADSSGEGSLRKEEINAAVAVWYTKVTEEEPKKSKACSSKTCSIL